MIFNTKSPEFNVKRFLHRYISIHAIDSNNKLYTNYNIDDLTSILKKNKCTFTLFRICPYRYDFTEVILRPCIVEYYDPIRMRPGFNDTFCMFYIYLITPSIVLTRDITDEIKYLYRATNDF